MRSISKKLFLTTFALLSVCLFSCKDEVHKHDIIVKTEKEPTCTEPGTKIEVCSLCGEKLSTTYLNPLGHDYDQDEICKRCGEKKHTHAYTRTVTKEATCQERGEATYTCECGASYTNTINKTWCKYGVKACIWCGGGDEWEAGYHRHAALDTCSDAKPCANHSNGPNSTPNAHAYENIICKCEKVVLGSRVTTNKPSDTRTTALYEFECGCTAYIDHESLNNKYVSLTIKPCTADHKYASNGTFELKSTDTYSEELKAIYDNILFETSEPIWCAFRYFCDMAYDIYGVDLIKQNYYNK